MGFISEFIPKTINYKLSRLGLVKPTGPLTLTFSVTTVCQSRCKSCNIWEIYLKNPKLRKKELKLDEIEKIFKSIGHVYFFNITGGEPFLRGDLPQIVKLACKYLTPRVIHTPTNALMPEFIAKKTEEILKIIHEYDPKVPFTIKPSFDGVGDKHDEIRGVPGNFVKLVDTIKRLQSLQNKYKNLDVGLGTVISKMNCDIESIKATSKFAHSVGVDSYINEIAEERSELYTEGMDITPNAEQYKAAIDYFSQEIRKNMMGKKKLVKFMQSFRLVYYELVVNILKEKTQVIPCYAGLTNAHINSYGDIWPCCILAYKKSMGNLKEADYDFYKVWHSERASDVRTYIKNKNCHCPLANQSYSNILVSPKSMLKVIKNVITLR